MSKFDLAVRGGAVVTASDIFRADVGIQVLNDRQLLDVFEVARRERAVVMVHAEGPEGR
jgi:hypothetical protein